MPLRNQPPSLQRAAMAVICENFEPLCYGSTAEEVAGMIDDDQYLSVRGPFMDMRELASPWHSSFWADFFNIVKF